MSSSSKKTSKPFSRNAGDWTCPDKSCGNLNFARRDHCNRCETAKPKDDSKKASEIGHAAAKNSRGLFSADDWSCLKCGNINWARRSCCNVCNAKKFADDQRTGYGGGYNERENVEYKARESSDSDYDEFGRRKKPSSRKSLSSKRSSRRDTRSRSRSRSSDSSSSSSSSDRSRRKRSRKSPTPKRDRKSSSSSSDRHSRRDEKEKEKPTSNNKNSKDAQKDRYSSSSSSSSSKEDEEESGSDEDLSKYNLFDDDIDIEAIKKGK